MRGRGPYVDTPASTDIPASGSVVAALQSHHGIASSPATATRPFIVLIISVSQSGDPLFVRPRTQRATSNEFSMSNFKVSLSSWPVPWRCMRMRSRFLCAPCPMSSIGSPAKNVGFRWYSTGLAAVP